ncbi:hypothetical protein FHG87_005999 [Trinorchestia longiramus]|nr:hypothetical protein FHG87_005999 [Trinorchestia longiramus]
MGRRVHEGLDSTKWFGKFRSGDESLKDEEGRGRLGSLENEQLHAVVQQNPRQSVREMSQTLGVSIATVLRHLKIVGKVKKLDKWVPHELNENQKLRRFEVCSMLSLRNTNDPFLDRIVTYDEKSYAVVASCFGLAGVEFGQAEDPPLEHRAVQRSHRAEPRERRGLARQGHRCQDLYARLTSALRSD